METIAMLAGRVNPGVGLILMLGIALVLAIVIAGQPRNKAD